MSTDAVYMRVLKKQREALGLSQQQLVKLSQRAFKTVQSVEAGDHNITLSPLEDIVMALGHPKNSIPIRRVI
jgi:predicted transcriptional regulator